MYLTKKLPFFEILPVALSVFFMVINVNLDDIQPAPPPFYFFFSNPITIQISPPTLTVSCMVVIKIGNVLPDLFALYVYLVSTAEVILKTLKKYQHHHSQILSKAH